MKKIFFILLLIQSITIWGQVPANDQTWVLQKQDSFSVKNTSNWYPHYPWDYHWNGYDSVYTDSSFLVYSGGWVKLKVDSLNTTIPYAGKNFKYKGSVMWSKFSYLYGYYEISAKLPQGQGFWPAFWLYASTTVPCSTGWVNEIDAMELNGQESVPGNTINNHYHWWDNLFCMAKDDGFSPITISGSDTTEHKYAVLWKPNNMIFYFDDQVIRTVENTNTPNHALPVILNLAIDDRIGYRPGTNGGNTAFPNYFQVNYMKIWQQAVSCGTAESFCATAFNKNTYNFAVKQSITIGGSGCTSSTLSTSDNISLWATDFILLDEGTTISDGGSGYFLADITLCPN